jgi:hypothetical protein
MTTGSVSDFAAKIPQRPLGLSAGELFDLTAREVERTMKEADGSRLEAAKILLKRLRENDLLTERDSKRLEDACELIFIAERGGRPLDDVKSKLLEIHAKILLDAEASPLATTMIGVAYANKPDLLIPGVAIVGGLFGSVVGFAVGGTGGAAVGFAVGFVVGAIAGACADDRV